MNTQYTTLNTQCAVNTKSRKYDLEDRVVMFAVVIIAVAEQIPPTRAGNHIAGQVIRAGTSPAPNYGEAQSAESKKDFVHKMKTALKELKETRIWLRILQHRSYFDDRQQLLKAYAECEELIRIFGKSISTATSRKESDQIVEN